MRHGCKVRGLQTTSADPWGTLDALQIPQMFDSGSFTIPFFMIRHDFQTNIGWQLCYTTLNPCEITRKLAVRGSVFN